MVEVLDSALKKSTAAISTQAQSASSADTVRIPPSAANTASPSDLQTTAEGQRLLSSTNSQSQNSRRHGRGPLQGDFLPKTTTLETASPNAPSITIQQPSSTPLSKDLQTIKLIARWKAEMPTEAEMLPKDKYTMFDKKVRGYRKGVHKLPKWTRVSQRLNPPGF